jgi:hypothetical protein
MRTLLVAAALLVFAGSAYAAIPKHPILRVADEGSPATVSGEKFKPNARVTVVVTGSKTLIRHVKTDARGAFELELPLVFKFGRCGAYTVSAIGPGGQRAFTGLGTTSCGGSKQPGIKIPSAGS